uniref:Uncharacterized protein n=1 Tax=Timema poppense TaxID=170557 RepID=A0A7R9H0G2_TIMPO|nr:unnamed protein product [Timema poppensis]
MEMSLEMKVAALVTLFALSAYSYPTSEEISSEWLTFKEKHGKVYDDEYEEEEHYQNYLENKKLVERHNAMYEKGEVTFTMALNKFADLTHDEVPTGLVISSERRGLPFVSSRSSVPDFLDWREKGFVNPIEDQGSCGSCWAFSAAGAVEGQYYKKYGKSVILSKQEIVDCSWGEEYDNYGCWGGWQDRAFEFLIDNGGVDLDYVYPYTATNGSCKLIDRAFVPLSLTGYVDVESGNEDLVQEAVATVGPISIALDASQRSFHLYNGGVYFEPNCTSGIDDLDHAILLIGYGTDLKGNDYWLVKNSWGTNWGEEGFMRIARNRDNNCGLATSASYPLIW